MSIRRASVAIAVAVLSGTVILAQSSSQSPSQTTVRADKTDEMPITLIGCLQREADYRRAHDLGRGGAIGAGLGSADEYVLINASRADAAGAQAPANIDCTAETTAEAYELTGPREDDLKPFVGRAVQITGMLKKAETEPIGTAGTGATRPTGGFDPLGQDLRLFEVNVTSFQEAAPASAAAAAPSAPAAAEAAPTATSGAEEQLPRTASPLPITGLLGLLSFGGALGLRAFRRR
jgi:hypothetical protein